MPSTSCASRRRARGDDAADDAAAVGGDLGVGRAGEPPPQLVAAIAGEHRVGVGIDEAGDDGAAVRVDDDGVVGERARPRAPVGSRADEDDRPVDRRRSPRAAAAGVGLPRADARRRTGAGQDLGGVVDQEVRDHAPSARRR